MNVSMIELNHSYAGLTSFYKTSFTIFFTNPEDKGKVLDKFHEALSGAGYSFNVSDVIAFGGTTVKLGIMKIKGVKSITFTDKITWLLYMKRMLCWATKDMGYMLHSAGFDIIAQTSYTATVCKEEK